MKLLLPLLAATLLTATASAQDKPPAPAKPSGTFSICLWPNPCGASGKAPAAPKPEAPKVEAVPAGDPLTRAVVNGTVARGDDGIVSSIRLSPAHTGTGREQIVTRGTGLRDALAPVKGSAALPDSKLPANKNGAKGAAEDEWVTVDSESASAGQLNEMRTERKASKSSGTSGAAAGRMFKANK